MAQQAKISKGILDVFVRAKPANLLLELRRINNRHYGSFVAKRINCTYSHAVKILAEMEKAKLISFERDGRMKNICLTENGHRLAEHLEKIKELLP